MSGIGYRFYVDDDAFYFNYDIFMMNSASINNNVVYTNASKKKVNQFAGFIQRINREGRGRGEGQGGGRQGGPKT